MKRHGIVFSTMMLTSLVVGIRVALPFIAQAIDNPALILHSDNYCHYIEVFNRNDQEVVKTYVDNQSTLEWMQGNIPWFDCPDKDMEEVYYFRWWTYRKHIKETQDGFVVTEFLPDVPWAGKYNTISCAAGHHFKEIPSR
jgi:hypothetical protein